MKLEKINENQIRCTLTREDLEMHQVNLRELAYGSEKAKKLFRDMMQQAQIEFGFEADNIPLMIEAIPVNLDSIILIITKVEDPEELDTRFSRFSPYKDSAQKKPAVNLIRQYTFTHLDDVIAASHGLNGFFTGRNTLYKTSANESYQLIIHQSSCSPQEFNKVCNILSEYGKGSSCTPAREAHLIEHGEVISVNALQQLIQL